MSKRIKKEVDTSSVDFHKRIFNAPFRKAFGKSNVMLFILDENCIGYHLFGKIQVSEKEGGVYEVSTTDGKSTAQIVVSEQIQLRPIKKEEKKDGETKVGKTEIIPGVTGW